MTSGTLIWDIIGRDKASPALLRIAGAADKTAVAGDRAAASINRLSAASERTRAVGATLTRHLTLPLLAIGAGAVKVSTDFNAAMLRIQTQAGASAKDVRFLSRAVLNIKDAQQGPVELANALYHLKSVGLANVPALKALRQASDLAAVGHANLEETTNALAGAWRTGIRGAQNFHQAVSTINAIIGAGNMTLEDFNAALGTGILPSAKTFGLTLKDVGSALALFTDEGVPADAAATRLRMTFSLLGAPSRVASEQLARIGLGGLKLAKDLRKPQGLLVAVTDLKTHLDASGLSAVRQSALLSRAFGGGRSSSAILSLVNNLDVLRQKYAQVDKGTSKFNEDVAAQRNSPAAQFHELVANLERAGVLLGNQILPYVTDLAKDLTGAVKWFSGLSSGTKKFAVELGAALIVAGPLLSIVGRLGSAFAFLWRTGAQFAAFRAGLAGVAAAEGRVGAGANSAGQKIAGAFTGAGRLARGFVSTLGGLGAGFVGAQVGGSGGGGWLTSILLGAGGGWALGGPVGAAIGGVSAAIFKGVGLWKDHKQAAQEAAQAELALVNQLTDAITADNGALGRNVDLYVTKLLQGKGILDKAQALGVSLASVVKAAEGNGGALNQAIASPENALEQRLKSLQGQLTPNLTPEQAAPINAQIQAVYKRIAAYEALRTQLQALGIDVGKALHNFRQTETTLNQLRNPTGQYANQLAQLRSKTSEAVDAQGNLTTTLRGGTPAAQHNRAVIISLAKAAQTDAEAVFAAKRTHEDWQSALKAADGTLAQNVRSILAAARAAGLNKSQVADLIATYTHLPRRVITAIEQRGVLPADIQAIIDKLNAIPRYLSVTIGVDTVNVGPGSPTRRSQVPGGHAAGTPSVSDGYFTVGEEGGPRGWELGRKTGSHVQIWSNRDSRRILGRDRLPGYASGTDNLLKFAPDKGAKTTATTVGALIGALNSLRGAISGGVGAARASLRGFLKDLSKAGASLAQGTAAAATANTFLANQAKLVAARSLLAKVTGYGTNVRQSLTSNFDPTRSGSVADLITTYQAQTGQNAAYTSELRRLRRRAHGNRAELGLINTLAASGQTASLQALAGGSRIDLLNAGKAYRQYNASVQGGVDAATRTRYGATQAHETGVVDRLVDRQDRLIEVLARLGAALAGNASGNHAHVEAQLNALVSELEALTRHGRARHP